MSISLLSPSTLARDLAVRDLTDPAQGAHALQLLIHDVTTALEAAWSADVRIVRSNPVVPVEDNYDRLRYPTDAVARDVRYTRYVSETCMLRSHTSAVVPHALRALAQAGSASGVADTVVACPGVVYRRDVIDRMHSGTPHQLDLWRVAPRPLGRSDLDEMISIVIERCLPGASWRANPAIHPYTLDGLEIEAQAAGATEWVEVAECGLAHPEVLAGAGLSPEASGLAMGVGLDRLLMLRKGIPDIRLLRSTDPRVAGQMNDLQPYREMSMHPPVRRDISVALARDLALDDESLGDRIRDALGDDASSIEEIAIISITAMEDLPDAAIARLGIVRGQVNVLIRVVLRHLDRALTDHEANELRDRIYADLHEGSVHQWAAR